MPNDHSKSPNQTSKTNEASGQNIYLQRVASLVPTEAIAVYLTIDQLILTAKNDIPYKNVFWFVLAIMTLGTLLYLRRRHPSMQKALLGTVSFLVWVAVAGNSFPEVMKDVAWYNPIYGSIFLPLFTFFLPMLTSTEPAPAAPPPNG
ncbi:MAG: hypothetical protein IPK82_19820 [Polyangiaceae bacterium]|nr:hypothetical protein [Polyangiaceae bacterium]